MTPDLIYREGTPADFDQLKELGLVAYGQYAPQLTPENRDILLANLNNEKNLSDLLANAKAFVCEHNGRIVGRAHLLPSGHPNPIYEANWSSIRMVGVHPEYSGRGIGKKLTQLCIDHAKQTNEKIIGLHTSEMMDAARHIYESLGFEIVKELPLIFGKRYWLYKLEI